MKTALVQMTSTDSPAKNLASCEWLVCEAVAQGARFILTPEVSNCIADSKAVLGAVLCRQEDDPFLARMRQLAAKNNIWILIGSLGLKNEQASDQFVNRSFLIDPLGAIVAQYDKIHMFDVDLPGGESYRESASYVPGRKAVLADTKIGKIGLSICYDLRFPMLYRTLAQAGAQVLTIPAAFAQTTGEAHWHSLLRARAIENGAYVLAPAQTGVHYAKDGKERRSYGHALAVSPWGEVLADAGKDVGICCFDLDLEAVTLARKRLPSLMQDSLFEGPE
ncbi:carbon-nitrogen hydrolase family protein [uncultured Lentibacter sp.]|uniref:carbon-nitrogen hydrolase family protein n=1 Tax=uncultured Lentibacter sp. TaxID=1659309 RepID=UPI0026267172|nr:carbon-nitrogen hydrolase family protein [uncultured Lentibacter sp.]